MNIKRFETTLNVDVEVHDRRMAENAEQAGEFAKDDVEEAIREALQGKLSGGSSSANVEVVVTRRVEE